MIALFIIAAVLLLLLILPLGVDLIYRDKQLAVYLKVAFLRFTISTSKNKRQKNRKKGKKKPQGKKNKSGKTDVVSIVKIIFKTLSRFCRSLSIDLLKLHIICGAEDPYDAVMLYGRLSAALSALRPLAHNALNIYREDVFTDLDVQSGKTVIDLRLTLTLMIWQILYIFICTGFSLFPLYFGKKKRDKQEAKALDKKG